VGRYALIGLVSGLLLQVGTNGQATHRKPPVQRESSLDVKLREAFPGDEWAVKAENRWEIRTKGLVVAADEVIVREDGKMKLAPCAIAWFGKSKEKGKAALPTAVRAAFAVLEFDGPVRHFPDDLPNLVLVSVELPGGMRLTMRK
jgi:hypothetical protein